MSPMFVLAKLNSAPLGSHFVCRGNQSLLGRVGGPSREQPPCFVDFSDGRSPAGNSEIREIFLEAFLSVASLRTLPDQAV